MDLREVLTSIHDKHGRLTPQDVVDEAKSRDHPLHSRFEWDNKIAGPMYRLVQARELIRSARVVRPGDDEHEPQLRAFVSVARETGFSYEPVEKVAADPLMTKITLQMMEREWRSMLRRYEAFDEFWQMVRRAADAA